MGDVVNLNQFRKRVQAEAAAAKAEANTIRHGRSKAERKAQAAEQKRQRDLALGHLREPVSQPRGEPSDPDPPASPESASSEDPADADPKT